MKRFVALSFVVMLMIGLATTTGCTAKNDADKAAETAPKTEVDMELQKQADAFLETYTTQYKGIYKTVATNYWKATNSGKEEDFAAFANANLEEKKFYSDKEKYHQLTTLLKNKDKLKPLTARCLEVLELSYKGNQLPPDVLKKIVTVSTDIEQTFNGFRGKLDGKTYSDNELKGMIKVENDSAKRRAIWEAMKQVGEAVGPRLVELAKLRNEAARQLGYSNFWEMSVRLQAHDPKQILDIFAELEQLTNAPFTAMKKKMDAELAARFKIKPEDMMPWHYDNPFFQEPSPSDKVDLDEFYKHMKKEDIIDLSKRFFNDIGLPIETILARSDLYEREGKQQHAFCIAVDREGDNRVLINVKPNAYWMDTTLHEMGHAVYNEGIDAGLPFCLRDPAHTFTTEAVALLMGALAKNPVWLVTYAGADEKRVKELEPYILEQRRREQLLFCRWSLVMLHFEKALYENPDQDMNQVWWDLAGRFQGLKQPQGRKAPDWASKIHFSIAPVYYHNYQLGELMAAQLRGTLVKMTQHNGPAYTLDYSKQKNLGPFFAEKIFKPGMRLPWPQFVEDATGEPLTARYFAEEVKPIN